MDEDFRKSRGSSPTQQELEFLFSLMDQAYHAPDIEQAYVGTNFPERDRRFIRMQRKYYDAAKKVLEERIKAEHDPLVIEARRKHFEDLCDLARRLQRTIKTFGQWLESAGFIEGNIAFIYSAFVSDDYEDNYVENYMYGFNKGRWGINLSLEVFDPLFTYLRQHLSNEPYQRLFGEWKELMGQDLHERYDKGVRPGERYMCSRALGRTAGELVRELDRIRQRRILPGKCGACP